MDQANCPGPGSGTPGDPFCTVQASVAAAAHGDEVLVAPGTYAGAIDLLGKRIHLRSSGGPEVTTFTNDVGSILTCATGETFDTIIEGFTFTGGNGTWATDCAGQPDPQGGYFGGAIRVLDSDVTIRRCTFTDNFNDLGTDLGSGGAIYVRGGNALVSESHFTDNGTNGGGTIYGSSIAVCGWVGHVTVTDSTFDANGGENVFGGGVYTYVAGATVERCTFTGNDAAFGGGVMGLPSGEGPVPEYVEVTDCEFLGNTASHGAGVFMWSVDGGHAGISTSEFISNIAEAGGGGANVYSGAGTATIRGNSFIGNWAHDGGGLEVIVSEHAEVTVDNCLMVDNHVVGTGNQVVGGGINLWITDNGRIDVANITSVENSAMYSGGGVYSRNSSGLGILTLANAIVRKNAPNQIAGAIDVSFSNVEGGIAGPGNIDANPRFVDTGLLNYRLKADSASIDTGANAGALAAHVDLDRQPRYVAGPDGAIPGRDPRIDQGAYENPSGSLLRFAADRVTLTWPVIREAGFYNMYRGDLSALVDGDGDGLPDAGHGVCANAMDPDTSDTEFEDVTLPDPADGFFYLMGTVDAAGTEDHLGTTSAGSPRQPGSACP